MEWATFKRRWPSNWERHDWAAECYIQFFHKAITIPEENDPFYIVFSVLVQENLCISQKSTISRWIQRRLALWDQAHKSPRLATGFHTEIIDVPAAYFAELSQQIARSKFPGLVFLTFKLQVPNVPYRLVIYIYIYIQIYAVSESSNYTWSPSLSRGTQVSAGVPPATRLTITGTPYRQ